MGNLYNVQQAAVPSRNKSEDLTQTGLNQWNNEVRKQIMEKLRGYAPEHVDKIIKATFGDVPYVNGI